MSQKFGPLLALLVVVPLSGLAAYVGANAALPPTAEPASSAGGSADLMARLDEIDRRLGYMDERLEAAEATAMQARDLADGLRERRPLGPAPSTAAPPTTPPATDTDQTGTDRTGTPVEPGAATAGPQGLPDLSQMSDEQLREARIRQIQESVRAGMRTAIPARLMELASTGPGAEEKRVAGARVEARQMAIALALTGDEADKLTEIYFDQLEKQVNEVGPLVRNGMAQADLDAVESRLTEGWTETDRRALEVMGDAKFQKFAENAGAMRSMTRDVLAELRKRAPK